MEPIGLIFQCLSKQSTTLNPNSPQAIFTIAGTLGRFALIDSDVLPANTNQAVAIIRADKGRISPEYLFRFGYTANESKKKAFPKMEMLFCFIDKSRVFLPIVRLKALIKHKY